jgi:hypothetical protein
VTSSPTPKPSTYVEDLPGPLPMPSRKGSVRTLSGTVSDGVEAGCLVLTTDEGLFQLLGPGRAGLRAGMRVAVDGAVKSDLATTCQQGMPFVVSSYRRA